MQFSIAFNFGGKPSRWTRVVAVLVIVVVILATIGAKVHMSLNI